MANVRKYGMFKTAGQMVGVDLRWQRLMRRKCAEDRNVLIKNVTDTNVGSKRGGKHVHCN